MFVSCIHLLDRKKLTSKKWSKIHPERNSGNKNETQILRKGIVINFETSTYMQLTLLRVLICYHKILSASYNKM